MKLDILITNNTPNTHISVSGSYKTQGSDQEPSPNPNSHKSHKLKAKISSKTKSELRFVISTVRGS
ncbi:hypothetical protein Hanom_Chr16g01486981 [Helianthus anomalus]